MKRAVLFVLPVLVIAGILLVRGRISRVEAEQQSQSAKVAQPPWERGDAYLYRVFFGNVSRISKEAEQAEQQGMNPQYLRTYYQRTVGLNDSQAILLNAIAADLKVQLARYDARAAAMQTERHILVQKKRLGGELAPPPSPDLVGLAAGRDVLILHERERLRQAFGDAEFQRLDTYIRDHAPWKRPPPDQPPVKKATSPVPDDVAYPALFRAIARFKARAQQERAWGLPEVADSMLTAVQRAGAFSDEQMRVLDNVAGEFLKAQAAYEVQAAKAALAYKRLSLEMLARDGRITPTHELAAVETQVQAIVKQMEELVETSIGKLRAGLGEEEFARLDAFAKRPNKVAPARNSKSEVTP